MAASSITHEFAVSWKELCQLCHCSVKQQRNGTNTNMARQRAIVTTVFLWFCTHKCTWILVGGYFFPRKNWLAHRPYLVHQRSTFHTVFTSVYMLKEQNLQLVIQEALEKWVWKWSKHMKTLWVPLPVLEIWCETLTSISERPTHNHMALMGFWFVQNNDLNQRLCLWGGRCNISKMKHSKQRHGSTLLCWPFPLDRLICYCIVCS